MPPFRAISSYAAALMLIFAAIRCRYVIAVVTATPYMPRFAFIAMSYAFTQV